MALFKLRNDYFQEMVNDPEFEKDSQRLYYTVKKIEYKGERIVVAIPLRSNINLNFQKTPDEYIATPPSHKTQTHKGNIAGWHITKMIPIDFAETITAKNLNSGLKIAEDIASKYSKQEFIDKVKMMLQRFEKGEKVFGAIDFDTALKKLKERQANRKKISSTQNIETQKKTND